jgi:hypothetical protein
MVRETSIEAYRSIEGKLGEKQKKVYEGFVKYGPKTNLELSKLLKMPINTVTPRTNELVKLELLREWCRRKCEITGRRSIVWGIPEDRKAKWGLRKYGKVKGQGKLG